MNGNDDSRGIGPPDLDALSHWAPELAKTFVSLASDIALVIDDSGIIRNVAQGSAHPIAPDGSNASDWVGKSWIDTVSGETRPKIENLLREVSSTGLARRREVNHPGGDDGNIPIAYTAIRLGRNGPVLAVGRDLRAVAAIQQRYVESQQEMERSYWKARQAEMRYQLLFQVATDAVLVLNAQTFQIIEANVAALELYQMSADEVHGRAASIAFEHHSRAALNELLVNARRSGDSGEIRARLQGTHASTSVVATPFRTHDELRLLVRVRALDTPNPSSAAPALSTLTDTLSRLVDLSSDGVVVTDSNGRIHIANPAFLALAQVATEGDLTGQPLTKWLSPKDGPVAALVAKVRRDGIARQVQSVVRQTAGSSRRVEVSAALLTEGDQECIGFTVHPVDAVPAAMDDDIAALSETLRAGIELLVAQLGERSMADLVGDAAALAERHFVAIVKQRGGVDPC